MNGYMCGLHTSISSVLFMKIILITLRLYPFFYFACLCNFIYIMSYRLCFIYEHILGQKLCCIIVSIEFGHIGNNIKQFFKSLSAFK